ncbi:MAG: YciI family protein [Pseudomonadota bacterium]
MSRYLLSIYQPDGPAPPPEFLEPIMAELAQVNADLRAAGGWVFAGGLLPPDQASVLRMADGELLVTDGPFVESKEHLGGFTVIEAPDPETALFWAARFARAITLPIELRPLRDDGA